MCFSIRRNRWRTVFGWQISTSAASRTDASLSRHTRNVSNSSSRSSLGRSPKPSNAALTVLIIASGALTAAVARMEPSNTATEEAESVGPRNITLAKCRARGVSRRSLKDALTPTRAVVIRDILRQGLDVVCLQEASPSTAYPDQMVRGDNQYLDLRNGLNHAGGSYQLTGADPDASSGTRMLYDTRRLALERSGQDVYDNQTVEGKTRHLVWAVLRNRATSTRFFVADTHLGLHDQDAQRVQWRAMIDRIDDLSDGLPVVVAGDFQRNRLSQPTADMLLESVVAKLAAALK